MPVVRVVDGPHQGEQFDVLGPQVVFGRHHQCDVVLDVAAVSRRHARIVRDADGYALEDLGSRNGTLLNAQPIYERTRLRDGDQITICDQILVYSEQQRAALTAEDKSSVALLVNDEADPATSTIMSTFSVGTNQLVTTGADVKLRALVEIAKNLGKSLALDEVLPKLVDSLFTIFMQADRVIVVLRRQEDGKLVPRTVRHRNEDETSTAKISRTIIDQAVTTKEAILSADAASDGRFDMAQSIAVFPIRSLMCAPLIDSDGQALGVIQVDTLNRSNRFGSEDLEVLAAVAAQSAIAVDNAQLYEQALTKRELERELRLAQQVQTNLLPKVRPEVEGYCFFDFYQPAKQVGGDYYDYVRLPDGRIAVVVADVSGKGVAAALLMSRLAGVVQAQLAAGMALGPAVENFNESMLSSHADDRFVTLIAAVLDPQTHELQLVNAGHMAPFLRRQNGQVEPVGEAEAGVPLGVVEGFSYSVFRRQLEPGEFMTLFTDGISEAMNADGDQYGLDRLQDVIGASAVGVDELGAHILADVRRFVDGRQQSDDICLACFGRNA